jgi:DNA processing protein
MSAQPDGSPEAETYTGVMAVLAGLTGMGPRRLRLLLAHLDPMDIVAALADPDGLPRDLAAFYSLELRRSWATELQASSLDQVVARCSRFGITAAAFGSAQYPRLLLADPVPPAVVFWRGELGLLTTRRVGIVGTRNPTRSGMATAGTLAQELAEAGIAVVSGLARGIDGAAHRGALSARGPVIAVVGNGPDKAYPASHRDLWQQVCDQGLLISEWPPGVSPDAYRFPMRNRILAALSEVVVVVESRESGGSLSTVREATLRGIPVMAVPGSLHTRASAGTNQLLCDGAPPVTCTQDVLVALGLHSERRSDLNRDPRPAVGQLGAAILERCRLQPQTLDDLCRGLSITVSTAALALARLERDGWVADTGGWFEVLGAWASVPGDVPGDTARGAESVAVVECPEHEGSKAIPYGT